MKGLYDVSTLETNFDLDRIPDFTDKERKELKEVRNKISKIRMRTDEYNKLSNRIGELQFLFAADFKRDLAEENFRLENSARDAGDDQLAATYLTTARAYELDAKQLFSRAERIRKGIDNY